MLKEFKDFITGGNVIEFAVAVIMAGAIGEVVKGFVSNIIMPIVGMFTGGVSLADKKIILSEAILEGDKVVSPENAILYGAWIDSIISLIIIGFVMFLMIKSYNKMKKKEEEAAPPAGPSDNDLLIEIRDALKK